MSNLFDKLTRYSMYIELYKNGESRKLVKLLSEMTNKLKADFATLEFETLSALTKAKLRTFLRKIQRNLNKVLGKHSAQLEKTIVEFMNTDRYITSAIMQDETGLTLEEAYNLGEGSPLATESLINDDSRLSSNIMNAIVPASGLLIGEMIRRFKSSTVSSILRSIKIGYSNKSKWKDVLAGIVGLSKNKFKDGKLNKTFNQNKALVSTLITHVHSIVSSFIKSAYYKRYIWDSVIDGATTDICRERNGNDYEFGDGPLPPAHFGCRSDIIPYTKKVDVIKQSFYSWFSSQPKSIQRELNPSGLKMDKFRTNKYISLDSLKGKLSAILK